MDGDTPRQRATVRPSVTSATTSRIPLRSLIRRVAFLLLPLVLLIGAFVYVSGGQIMSTEDAYVEADRVGVSTDVPGIVNEIAVTENQHVDAGQVLYRFSERPYRIALNRAEGQLGVVRNDLLALKATYQNIEAQIKEAQDDVDYYDSELRRQQNLLNAHVVSETAFTAAQRNARVARQKVVVLNKQLAGTAASLGGDPTTPVEELPQFREAQAQRDEAQRQLEHTVVKAPFAGIVTDVTAIAVGKSLPASAVAFYLVASDHIWIEANPKETELTYVRPGQPVTVSVDTYPGVAWRGAVESISPAASQAFSLLPAQNTSGNWVKVVQRIPMRVRVDTTEQGLPPLRVGMSVEIAVDTGHRRGWPWSHPTPAEPPKR